VTSARRCGWDILALIASLLTVVITVIYVWAIEHQGGRPVAWFLGVMVMCALLGAYGVATVAPRRATALTISGVILVLLGILGLASIGIPMLGAGALALLAAARAASRQ
jgi:hypothetical protein